MASYLPTATAPYRWADAPQNPYGTKFSYGPPPATDTKGYSWFPSNPSAYKSSPYRADVPFKGQTTKALPQNPFTTTAPTTTIKAPTPQAIQDFFTNLYKTDPNYIGQSTRLQSQLGQQWLGSVIGPTEQALIQYGGNLPPEALKQLSGIATPQWIDPLTGKPADVGPNLSSAFSDPTVTQGIENNKFSTLAQIQHQRNLMVQHNLDSLGARGIGSSGGVLQHVNEGNYAADLARYNATNDLSSQISGAVQNFLGLLTPASEAQAGYLQSVQSQIMFMLQNGLLSIPGVNVKVPGSTTDLTPVPPFNTRPSPDVPRPAHPITTPTVRYPVGPPPLAMARQPSALRTMAAPR